LSGRHSRDDIAALGPDDLVVDHLADAVVVVDERSHIARMNPAACRLFGYATDRPPTHLDALLPPALQSQHAVTARRADGTEFPAQVSLSHHLAHDGTRLCIAVVRDITEWRRLEHTNDELRSLLTGILESTDTELAVVNEHLMLVTANASFRRQFAAGADPTGMSLSELAGMVSDPPMLDVLQAVRDAVELDGEVRLFCCARNGGVDRWFDVTATPLRIRPGAMLRAREVTSLVDAARSGVTDRVHDPLTGLLSRDRLEALMATDLEHNGSAGLCVTMLDIDQFGVVKETLGYHAGDDVLQQVAANLQRHVPDTGRLARMAGDTFCITFHPQESTEVDRVSSELRDAVRQPITMRGRTLRITASVGSTVTGATTTVDQALQQAETAMQEAKRRGGNRCVLYAPAINSSQDETMRLWNALRSALQFRQMEVWFQPVVSLATERPIAIEALCRWHHPQFGDVSPGEFIPIAERNSEILHIGSFVHGRSAEVMNVLRATRALPLRNFQVSINASPNEIAWPQFASNLLARLRANEASPEWFSLEITERALVMNDDAVRSNLATLADAGVTITLDDYGTGYSSLEQLVSLNVSRVKIDRSFVARMIDDEPTQRLVAAMIAMAHDLQMDTVAEGVETSAQAAALRALGCHSAQGFLYAPAVPETELLAVLSDLLLASSRHDAALALRA
jgi:diguanylate cyclase (GGDEF)-like protein